MLTFSVVFSVIEFHEMTFHKVYNVPRTWHCHFFTDRIFSNL